MAKVRVNLQGQALSSIGAIQTLEVRVSPSATEVYTVGADGIIEEDVPAEVATILCNMDGRRFRLVTG